MCFPGPNRRNRVLDANGISIASAFFAELTRWQTDRPRYSVSNNRRSTQWRSQILLLSTATTSNYWSSWLDRSDQFQQSAPILSCKTKRVAVYLETHCSICSKRAFPIGVLDRWHNCLLTHKLFSSCIRQYQVPRACDWVIPALSVVLLTFNFQFSLLFSMSVARQL